MAEIASAIGNGASSAVGDDVMLVKIQKKRPLETNVEDEFLLDDVCSEVEVTTTEKTHGSKAAKQDKEVVNTQSWMMSSVTRTPMSRSSLSLESRELANVAQEAMGSLARNIMQGGVGMFEVLLEKQRQLQVERGYNTPSVSDEASTTTSCKVCFIIAHVLGV